MKKVTLFLVCIAYYCSIFAGNSIPNIECDKIIGVSGKEQSVKVLEISLYKILFKACDPLNDTIYEVKRNKIKKIEYVNGTEEYPNIIRHTKKVSEDIKKTNECDILILKNKGEIDCRIIEEWESNIHYKRCDNQDGPVYIYPKSEVKSILYSKYGKPVSTNPLLEGNQEKEIEPFSIASILFSSLGVGFLGLIMGIISLNRINKNKERYKLKGIAIAGTVIGAIETFFMLMIVFLFVVFIFFM